MCLQLFSNHTSLFADATVYFSQSTYSVNEDDGTVQLVLTLNTSITVDVTVLVRSNDVTANGKWSSFNCYYISNLTGDNDYNSISQNVTIPSGTTNTSFSVAIMNDNMLEDTEDFTLTIMSTSQRDVTIDNSSRQATINIVDNDGKQIQITIIHVFNWIRLLSMS